MITFLCTKYEYTPNTLIWKICFKIVLNLLLIDTAKIYYEITRTTICNYSLHTFIVKIRLPVYPDLTSITSQTPWNESMKSIRVSCCYYKGELLFLTQLVQPFSTWLPPQGRNDQWNWSKKLCLSTLNSSNPPFRLQINPFDSSENSFRKNIITMLTKTLNNDIGFL